MIRALIALNGDGRCVRKCLFGLPSGIEEHDGIQQLCNNTLLMYTLKIHPESTPTDGLIKISQKSLVSEDDDKLAYMAGSLETKEGVGDITVLGNRTTLNALDYLGLSYELDVLCPNGTEIPESIMEGWSSCGEDIDDGKYTVHRFVRRVTDATDTQISDAIAGIETYFNSMENMPEQDRDAVNKIAKNVALLNRAIERKRSQLDSYDDGNESETCEEMDMEGELDMLWETNDMFAHQLGDITNLINDLQLKVISFITAQTRKDGQFDRINNRFNIINDNITSLREQFGVHIEEHQIAEKKTGDKKVVVLYVLVAVSIVLNLINLLLA